MTDSGSSFIGQASRPHGPALVGGNRDGVVATAELPVVVIHLLELLDQILEEAFPPGGVLRSGRRDVVGPL
jgi:hypothetical protein